jgi:hypothetical protein
MKAHNADHLLNFKCEFKFALWAIELIAHSTIW